MTLTDQELGGVELFDTYKGISVYDLLKEKVKLKGE